MATILADIHPDIIRTHILPKLDGPSLSSTTTVSPFLNNLCSDDALWTDISTSTWPSIMDPRVNDVISTFPLGHHSFFKDSFPSLTTEVNHLPSTWSSFKQPDGSSCLRDSSFETFISAVDICYQNNVIYSNVQFTDTTDDFLSSPLHIELNDNNPTYNPCGSINLQVDELAGADEATLSHLKESLTLSWILIDPARKRACNLSSIKPVSVRRDWMSNEPVLRFVTVLPGPNPNETVQCKIQLVLTVVNTGLQVKHVRLKSTDLNYRCLNGSEFLVITKAAVLEENNVTRKVIMGDDKGRWMNHNKFKEIKRAKKNVARIEDDKRDFAIKINYIIILVSFCFSTYFLNLLLD